MRVAVTAQGSDLESRIDPRFGRARYFVIGDTSTGDLLARENSSGLEAPQGAGVQAAETVVRLGVSAVITGHIGPNALATLQAGHVAVYLLASGTVREALAALRSGRLTVATEPDTAGHAP
jgi:predicted Fe-Mo cluster-binding NifX family protein